MRNKYPGTCMECGKPCGPDEGFAHRRIGRKGWSAIHAHYIQGRFDRMTEAGLEPDRPALITDERSR